VRDPAARATMDKVRSHVWVNIGYDDLPLLHLPAIMLDDVKEDQIDKMISHIVQKPGYVAYTIRSAQGMFTSSDDDDQVSPLPNIKPFQSGSTSLQSQELPLVEPVVVAPVPPTFDRGRRHSVATTVPTQHVRAFSLDPEPAVLATNEPILAQNPQALTVPQAQQLNGRARRYSVAVDAPLILPTVSNGKGAPLITGERPRRHSVMSTPSPAQNVQDTANLRSLRFAFTDTTTTNKYTPEVLYKKLTVILDESEDLSYKATAEWIVTCTYLPKGTKPQHTIIFEVEICKVWLLKLIGVRMKRLSGNALEYKTIYERVVRSLNL